MYASSAIDLADASSETREEDPDDSGPSQLHGYD
jgi:hypothetical protein